MKNITFVLLVFLIANGYNIKNTAIAQTPEQSLEIKNPTMSRTLRVESFSHCTYSDNGGNYIINPTYVIYQDCDTQFVFYPDMATFTLLFPFAEVFASDKNGIYYRGKLLNVGSEGFEVVDTQARSRVHGYYMGVDYLWKTDAQVFFGTEAIDVAHPKSFQANEFYFEDDEYVYYIDFYDDKFLFERVSKVAIQQGKAQYKAEKEYYEGERVQKVNRILYKTSKHVLINKGSGIEPMFEKAMGNFDVATLKRLSEHYSMDKNHIYFGKSPVPIARERFPFVKVFDQVNSHYVTDGIVIYQNDSILRKGLDAATFGMFPQSDFYYDKNGIYQRSYDEDLQDLVNIKFPFIYKEPVSSQNATYQNPYFIYGNQAVYPWGDAPEHFINLTSQQIEQLKAGAIRLANIAGKTVTAEAFAYDLYKAQGRIYWAGKLTQADAATFKKEGNFFKDKNHLYHYDSDEGLRIVKGINPNNMKVARNGFYDDGTYLYYFNLKIIKSKDWELLATYTGYRKGCSLDSRPYSDFYLLKNAEGYYLAKISDEVILRFLGKKKPKESTFLVSRKSVRKEK